MPLTSSRLLPGHTHATTAQPNRTLLLSPYWLQQKAWTGLAWLDLTSQQAYAPADAIEFHKIIPREEPGAAIVRRDGGHHSEN